MLAAFILMLDMQEGQNRTVVGACSIGMLACCSLLLDMRRSVFANCMKNALSRYTSSRCLHALYVPYLGSSSMLKHASILHSVA